MCKKKQVLSAMVGAFSLAFCHGAFAQSNSISVDELKNLLSQQGVEVSTDGAMSIMDIIKDTRELEAQQSIEIFPRPPALPDEILMRMLASKGILLSPEQIKTFRMIMTQNTIAEELPLVDVNMVNSTIVLGLGVSSEIETINLVKDFDTFIKFIDSSGNPWPVELISIGSTAFKYENKGSEEQSTEAEGARKSHIIKLVVSTPNQTSNLTVGLKGIDELINFKLVNNALQKDVSASITFSVSGASPTTTKSITNYASKNTSRSSNVLTDKVLDNTMDETFVPGAVAVPLLAGDSRIKATFHGGHLYIKAPYDVMPAPDVDKQFSRGGYTAFRAKPESLLMFMDKKGRVHKAVLADDVLFEALDDYSVQQTIVGAQ
jgi:intracellular multiplication protein IcmK